MRNFPDRLTVELTNHCNQSCAMCPSQFKPDEPKGYMHPVLFRRIIDEAAEHLPVTLVPFFRGESLLHPGFRELLLYAHQKGLKPIQLATNGKLVTSSVASWLLELPIDFISFSLPVTEQDLESSVHSFIYLRNYFKSATEVQVSTVAGRKEQWAKENFIYFWKNHADRVRIYAEHSKGGVMGKLDVLPAPDMARRTCAKVEQDMVILWDGRVHACCYDWFRDTPLGNVNDQSIEEIWQGAEYKFLRQQHHGERPMTDPVCSTCDMWVERYLDPPLIGELYLREND